MTTALANYDEGRRRIQLAKSHDEVSDIRDKAQALSMYARLAKDSELLAWASEIKVRAERRAGQLIAEAQRNGKLAKRGDNQHTRMSRAATSSLADAGITRDDSSKWQRMASIAEDQFERAIASAKDQIGEVTTAFVLRSGAPAKPNGESSAPVNGKPAPIPLDRRPDRDGQLARFYVVVRGCEAIVALGLTPKEWFHDAPPELRRAIINAVAPAEKWLGELLEIME